MSGLNKVFWQERESTRRTSYLSNRPGFKSLNLEDWKMYYPQQTMRLSDCFQIVRRLWGLRFLYLIGNKFWKNYLSVKNLVICTDSRHFFPNILCLHCC